MAQRKKTVKKSISFARGTFYRLEKYAKKYFKHRISTATNHLVDSMLDEAEKYHVKLAQKDRYIEDLQNQILTYKKREAAVGQITGRTVGQILEASYNNNNNNNSVPVVQYYQKSRIRTGEVKK